MGNTESIPEAQIHLPMEQSINYPDMNVIFKGIPKMMQVADDMHRMTNYIMDLRNMTLGLSVLTFFGMFMLLLLKYLQGKQSKRRKRRIQNLDSEQSSLSRTIGPNNGGGFYNFGMNSSRYHYQKQPHHFDWSSSRHMPIDMEKLIESQNSSNTAVLMNNHRQTPPQQRVGSFVATANNLNGGGTSASVGSTGTTITIHDFPNEINEIEPKSSIPVHSTSSRIVGSSIPLPTHSSSVSSSTSASTPLIIPSHHYYAPENNHLSRLNGNNNANGNNSHSNYGIKVSSAATTTSSSLLTKNS